MPIAFITAKAGKNVQAVLNLAQNLHKQASRPRQHRRPQPRAARRPWTSTPPPMRQNRRPKVYYATQVATNPPTIVLFTNGPELFDNTYQRYLIKTFRDQLAFSDVPIKLYLRSKNRGDNPNAEERAEEKSRKSKVRTRKPKVDVSRLPFKTDLSEKDKRRGDNPYEASELWTDL